MRPEDLLLANQLSPEKISQFLKRYGFKDPESADRNLQLIAEELSMRLILARIIKKLLEAARQCPDPDAALNHFERLFAKVTHRANFLGFLGETPEALEALIVICGSSPFSAEILIRNPEYFYWLLDQIGSPWAKSGDLYLQEARQAMGKFEGGPEQIHTLARFKRREMLRIGARDILKVAGVAGTIAELSNLADAVLQAVYEVCLRALVEQHGKPRHGDPGSPQDSRFTILAMGKLGGQELNYSSDIDLIYVYDGEHGHTETVRPLQRSISNPEFFTKLAQSITHELSTVTEEGYFYRVDLRLRPEGSAGPVASSLSACRNYYGSWGETFERLALIKARTAAGSIELGNEFCESFRPFVYRKFLDFAALEEIQEIKGRIEAKLASRKMQSQHVKLGAGGIREIEFFVQALQLIYGGQHPQLQERSTLRALDRLLGHELFSRQEHDELRDAYVFLRDVEHKLQMVYHFQTHELPSDPGELYKCSRRMGFQGKTPESTIGQFLGAFEAHRGAVQRNFQNLITFRHAGSAGTKLREASLVLNKNLSEAEGLEILAKPGFDDSRSALHQVVLLRDAPSFAHSPSKMRNLLANLLPQLLGALQSSPDPDTGLSYFERFATVLGARDALYTLLNESPVALHRLVQVLSCSHFLADFLCRKPEFLDFLLRDEFIEGVKPRAEYLAELQACVGQVDGWEEQIAVLRNQQQVELFRIQVKDVLVGNHRHSTGAQLASLAEACLLAAFQMACRQLGRNGHSGFSQWAQDHLVILALGKLGGSDLSYNSDLDLVYFYSVDPGESAADVQTGMSGVVETMNEILSVSRGEGAIYHIDTRLRPEGKKGGMVAAIHRYEEYLNNRAQSWERLALVRHRFVLGSIQNRAQLGQILRRFIYERELAPQALQEIVHVRQRMESEIGKEEAQHFHIKAGHGGLTDIEFAVQLLQMRYGSQNPELRSPGTLAAMYALVKRGLLRHSDYFGLYLGYEFLRFVENRLRISSTYGAASLSRAPKSLARIARLLGYSSVSDLQVAGNFEEAYANIAHQIRSIYQSIVSRLFNSSS